MASTSFIKQNDVGGGDFINSSPDGPGIGSSKTWFSYDELSAASNGFASQNFLGAGRFG
ncbi:hypothetical protein BVRB_2g026220 [Beta vulgaris subsp. vulgaris]|nr:hypothetical protein BVRB_2g026220 [Beta vulgaris subsp. vulgaris]